MKCTWKRCTNEARSEYKQLSFCSKNCNNKYGIDRLRTRRKQEAVDYLGGKCSKCGYSKCLDALCFHHLDPNKKSFEITRGITLRWDRIKEEINKCILLCANCHAEIHAELPEGAGKVIAGG